MSDDVQPSVDQFDRRARCQAPLDITSFRCTDRAFLTDYSVPRAHYELIIEAAGHAPSRASSQPWHCR